MDNGLFLGPQSLQRFAVDFPLIQNARADRPLDGGLDRGLSRNICRGLEPGTLSEIAKMGLLSSYFLNIVSVH